MRTFLVTAAAALMALSGFLFDSDLVKNLPVAYPFVFLALSGLSLIAILRCMRGSVIINKPSQVLGLASIALVLFGAFVLQTFGLCLRVSALREGHSCSAGDLLICA
jgi:hypothetical protein